MSERRGYLAGLAAYVIWGFFPLYFRELLPSSPGEILAHRMIWSLVCVAILTTFLRRWRRVAALRHKPVKLAGIALAGFVVALNWFIYIYGVNTGHVVETSLGYFITPLISVLFGVLVFRERLRGVQWIAIGIGTLAVFVIAVDYGRLPWIALVLAVSFATYGLIKKRLGVPPIDGLLLETSALLLPALAYVIWLTVDGRTTFGSVSAAHTALLILAGAITALPLLLFADSANRLPMTNLGVLQYTAPILQFFTGVYLLREPMPVSLLIGFSLVWVALIVFTWDAIRDARRSRQARGAREPAAARAGARHKQPENATRAGDEHAEPAARGGRAKAAAGGPQIGAGDLGAPAPIDVTSRRN
jgi:chloramphenicol-sensitive protein RarD